MESRNRTSRVIARCTPLSLTEAAQMDDLIDAIATCIVGCQGRTNRDRALAVLAVIEEQGFRVVPVEPLPEMVSAGLAATAAFLDIPGSAITVNREKMRRRYVAMLSAAPGKLTPPKEEA